MRWLDFMKRFSSRKIAIYADFIDPFCYVGFHLLRPMAESHGIELDWRGFELNPATPLEGMPLVTAENSDLRPGMWASVSGLAQRAGLVLAEPQQVPNTRLAHVLVEVAKTGGVTNPLIERIYQAYFRGQQNIGQKDILIDLASTFNISKDSIQAAWVDPKLMRAIESHRTEAHKRQFLGLPGFVYKQKNYFGALSQEAWSEILNGAKATNRREGVSQ